MLQLIEQPAAITFSRNPVVLKLRALDADGFPYAAMGVRSEFRVNGFTDLTEDEEITISWIEPDGTTSSLVFVAKDAPTASDLLEIPADVTGYISYTEFYTAIAEKIQAHPLIGPYFKLYTIFTSGVGQSLWIETLELNDDWSVSFAYTDSNPIYEMIDYSSTVATNQPDNYRVWVDLIFEAEYRSTVFTRATLIEGFPDEAGYITIDLKKAADAEFKNSMATPPIPAYDNALPVLADNLRRYYIRYREDYDDIVSPSWTELDIALLLCGGIAQSLFAQTDYIANIDINASFLTWWVDGKTVRPEAKEYLHWYNYTGVTRAIILQVKTYGEGGLLATDYIYNVETPVSARSMETISIPVGLYTMGIDPEGVLKYTITAIDFSAYTEGPTVTPLSQLRTYYVDQSYQLETRQIMYLNSFCLPETIICTGIFTNQLEVDRSEAERILAPDYNSATQQVYQHDQAWNNFFTYRTGFLRKVDVEVLQELLIYGQAYELFADAYIALLLKDKKFRISETRENLASQVFTAVPALRQDIYSNLTMVEIPDRDNWLITGSTGYWITTFGTPYALTI